MADKPEYPELWFMFDAVNTLVANMHEFGDEEDEEEEYGFSLNIEDTEYWAEVYDTMRDFSSKTATELEGGNILIAPIEPDDKESVLKAFTELGFVAKKATDADHEELIRELDKLATIKGGESKKYKG